MEVWALNPKLKRQKLMLPVNGFYVANLVGGIVTVTINGISEKHLPGEFWVVPDGKSMYVQLEGQNAVLQTISFNLANRSSPNVGIRRSD